MQKHTQEYAETTVPWAWLAPRLHAGVWLSYTRGKDLSGSLQGAGGISGLLVRTDHRLLISDHSCFSAGKGGGGNGWCAE